MAIQAINAMNDRYNGLGGGFAAYGIYPEYRDFHTLHVLFDGDRSKDAVEQILSDSVRVVHSEEIPTRREILVKLVPGKGGSLEAPEYLLWRYFVEAPKTESIDPDDFIVGLVMRIYKEVKGAAVLSSGRNMGVFKASGFPSEVADFYRIDDYDAYLWLAHGRYPTNTPGWWGGAHPFNVLDWSVAHNGELSSYDTNRRFLKMWGYECNLLTDTEVITYLFDLLVRKHHLPIELAANAMAPAFWKKIDRLGEKRRKVYQAIRMVYGAALLNGPFSIVVGKSGTMIGLTDRIKLRPLIAAKKGALCFLASEEAAIRSVCPVPDKVWAPDAGAPVIASVGGNELVCPA